MTKEIGPREKALREQREARFDENRKLQRNDRSVAALANAVAAASQKRGKPRKAKK
jgi:hypothetical protein